MTIIGSGTTVVTLSTAHPNVTITGTINAYGIEETDFVRYAAAVFGPASGHFTILNTGLIESFGTEQSGAGILLANTGTVTNKGTIIGGEGLVLQYGGGASSVVNTGYIQGSLGSGIVLGKNGTVENAGLISARLDGIDAGGYVLNSGTIHAATGIESTAGTAVNTGTIITTPTGDGIFTTGPSVTVINQGIISGGSFGLYDDGSGMITNAGTISAIEGIYDEAAPGGVLNEGAITATGSIGIYVLFGASVTNTGYVRAAGNGIQISGAGQVKNAGTIISGAAGINQRGGGIVVNAGAITGNAGILFDYGLNLPGTVTNTSTGTITGERGNATVSIGPFGSGVELTDGGSLYNAGLISGEYFAVYIQDHGYVTNIGTILSGGGTGFFGDGTGLGLYGGGTADNTGTVSAATAIFVGFGGAIPSSFDDLVINGGLLTGGTGIAIEANYAHAKTVTNSGTIAVSGTGIYSAGTATMIYNAGLITGAIGISLSSNAYLNNSGAIRGAKSAIIIGADGQIYNEGLVTGGITAGAGTAIYSYAGATIVGTNAVDFTTHDAANRLILAPTALISGTVRLDGGALELEAGPTAGTFASKLSGAAAITVASAATWHLAGAFTAPAITNNGTITEAKSDHLTISGALTGHGKIAFASTLTLEGSAAASQKIAFTGKTETLVLDDATQFASAIQNFALADTISLAGISRAGITGETFAHDVLTLTENAGAITLTFAADSALSKDSFEVGSNAAGTAIFLSKTPMNFLSPGAAGAALPLATAAYTIPSAPLAATTSSSLAWRPEHLMNAATLVPLVTLGA